MQISLQTMTEPLYQLLYLSSARAKLTEEALLELLAESQSRNAKYNITGLLLHADGSIIQVLEGEKGNIEKLFSKIKNDSRHIGVTVLSRRYIKNRDFPEFSMGFRREQTKNLEANIPGFSSYVNRGYIPESKLDGLSTLVATFIKTFAKSTRIRTD